nr:hypothetical protein [uncultured bacterium]
MFDFIKKLLRREREGPVNPKPRAVLPDAEDGSFVYLFKACSLLRLTYEIRHTTSLALKQDKRLSLEVRPETNLAPELEEFAYRHNIRISRGTE